MAKHQQLGGRVGPRIARVVSDAMAEHLHKSASVRAAIHSAGLNKFADLIGDEARPGMGPIWQQLADAPDLPPHLKQLFSFAATGRGEWSTALNLIGASAVGQSGLGAFFANALAPFTQPLIGKTPNMLLSFSTYAQLVAARIIDPGEMHRLAGYQGIGQPDIDWLLEATYNRPELSAIIELLRRGQMTEAEAIHTLRRQGMAEGNIEQLLHLRHQPLQPADGALMVLRGIIDQGEGHKIAAEAGLSSGDFDRLVLATGEPPGAESLMMALRRGFIDQERFAHGIRQSRIRNEWIDVMDKLRFSPMATADAVQAVVRNYIPESEGKLIAEQNGLKPDHWATLLKSHGRPLAHGQMIELQRRGLVTQAQVDQAVRESDVKDKYVSTARGLYHHLPPERLIVTMVQHNGIDPKRGLHLLEEIGFAPDIAAAIVKTGTSQRTAGHKQLALGQVIELYEDHAIDEAHATTLIEGLGYPAADVPLILKVAELKRHRKWRDQAVGAVRTGYLKRHLTEQQAQAELGAIGLPAAEVTWLLRLWDIELLATRRQLTEAQIIHGMRLGVLTDQQAAERLVQLGYSAPDAAFLVETAGPIPKGA